MLKNVLRFSMQSMKLLAPTGVLRTSKILFDQYPHMAKLPKVIDLFKYPIKWEVPTDPLLSRYPNVFEFKSNNYTLQLEFQDIISDEGEPQSSCFLWGKSTVGDANTQFKKLAEFDSLPAEWVLPRPRSMPAV